MTNPRRWEYEVDAVLSADASSEKIKERLDAMGAEGWELVTIDEDGLLYRCVYKRLVSGEEDIEEEDYDEGDYDEDYNEEDYDEDGSIRVDPPPPSQPKGFWGRR